MRRHFAGLLLAGVMASSLSCMVQTDSIEGVPGTPGHNGEDGQDGMNGTDGVDGQDGMNGKDGVDGKVGASPFVLKGQDAYYTAGNIGVGEDTPQASLHVRGRPPKDGLGLVTSNGTTVAGTDPMFPAGIAPGDEIIVAEGMPEEQRQLVTAVDMNAKTVTTVGAFNPPVFPASAFKVKEPIARATKDDGTPAFIVNSQGRVGVGTATPAEGALDVVGSIRTQGDSAGSCLFVLTSTAPGGQQYEWDNDFNGIGNLGLYNRTANNYPVVFKSNGNVGIGTDDPAATLHVVSTNGDYQGILFSHKDAGNLPIEGNDQGGVFFRTDAAGNANKAELKFSGSYSQNAYAIDAAKVSSGVNRSVANLILNPSGGKVGIGTVSPSYPLEVAGDTSIGAGALVVGSGNEIWTQPQTDGTAELIINNRGFKNQYQRARNFKVYDGMSKPVLSVIGSNGNVGIGNTNPGYKLDVVGGINVTDKFYANGVCVAGCNSDRRLKQNIAPLSSALDRVLRLRGVTYEWKDPEKHGNLRGAQIGMIAQEVEQVFPEWIGEDGDGYKTLTYRGFEALTVESLRELKSENDKLKAQNTRLEERLSALEGPAGPAGTSGARLSIDPRLLAAAAAGGAIAAAALWRKRRTATRPA